MRANTPAAHGRSHGPRIRNINGRCATTKTSLKDIQQMRKLYAEGMQQSEIAKRFKVSPSCVFRYCRMGRTQQEMDIDRIAGYKGRYPVFATALPCGPSPDEDTPLGEIR